MTEPRTYVVGLPVVITVDDDGTVTYDIDTAEAGQAVREQDDASEPYDDDTIYADADAIDRDHDRRQ